MGVNNLWELLLPIGRRIDIDSLEGKVLAIDASIWLTQFLSVAQKLQEHGSENNTYGYGASSPVHYLANTLKRLCRLRHGGIRPVLVFDGATPEIKRRELRHRRRQRRKRKLNDPFEGEESVQRAAKRLLSRHLIKGADGKLLLKAAVSTAEEDSQLEREMAEYEKLFHEPSGERTKDDESQKESVDEVLARKLQEEEEWQTRKRVAEKERDIVDLLNDDAYLEEADLEGGPNDWDLPHPDPTRTTGEGTTEDGRDTRDRPEQAAASGRLDPTRFHAGDGTRLAVANVAHLDPDERTRVVEDARKNRYLASRREYLEVACDPQGLSQTQLRNFLKYTRLNQDIAKMAKEAAKLQQERLVGKRGEDQVGRIIFEKADDDASLGRPRPTARQKQEQLERFKAQRLSLLQDTDDEGDEKEEEDDWRGNRIPHQSGDSYFRRPAVLEEDEEEEEDEHDKQQSMVKRNQESGGGFFVPIPEPMQSSASPTKKRIQLRDDESDVEDVIDLASHDDDDGMSPVQGTKLAAKSDATIAQELHDEEMARALQYQEDGGGGFLVDATATSKKRDDAGGGGFLPDQQVQIVKTVITIHSEDDDMDKKPAARIDAGRNNDDAALAKNLREHEGGGALSAGFLMHEKWTDTPSCNDEGGPRNNLGNDAADSDDDDDDDIEWEEGEKELEQTKGVTIMAANDHKSKEAGEKDVDSEDDQDVDWENGGDDSGNLPPSKSPNTATAPSSAKHLRSDNESDQEIPLSDPFHGNDWDAGHPSSSKAWELSAALKQAQATAANLTNWAGRAFRRAVAAHAAENGAEVPDSAKPKAITTEAIKLNQDSSSTKLATIFQKELREKSSSERGAAKMSGPSQSTAPGKKAFDFLETIPTVDEYASLHAATNVRDDSANMDPTTSGGVTEEMRNEVMELLHLFGIPYIVAPAEAEAQCVELERLGLVDGIVTEDSDAFVFGGKIVYKNLFKDQKYLEAYHSADAKDEMNLTRDSFVALAMLLGGDYTEGIKGVGIVNAMEILLAFGISEDCKAGLTRFREWLDGFDPEDLVKGGDSKNKSLGVSDDFHRKHRTARSRWVAPKYFPDDKVMTAYWNPVVDNSEERFSWGEPDLDGLILFLNKQLGWPAEQTKTLINPIIDRLKRTRMHQTRLDSFMKYEDGIKFADIRSKRLQSVLKATVAKKKTGNTSGEEKKNEK